jgi:hypothetical protein
LVIFLAVATAWPPLLPADISVVRELTIAPKNGRVAANIGSVNQSYHIRMAEARVAIEVGELPKQDKDRVSINVRAVFTLINDSADRLNLTVGFPVSNSRYSAFGFKSFAVETDGTQRSVFQRISGYPRHIQHLHVSGPDKDVYTTLPDFPEFGSDKDPSQIPAIKQRTVFVTEKIGTEDFHNLMVWKETFDPRQTRHVHVHYAMAVPPQKNAWRQKKVSGSYKGVWPQEANNMPLNFLESIPQNESYFFFDYYLTTGASWKGPIGKETIFLHLHDSWHGHQLYSNHKEMLQQTEGKKSGPLTYTYILQNTEPVENLYFALQRPKE